jgi:hypothetical protein
MGDNLPPRILEDGVMTALAQLFTCLAIIWVVALPAGWLASEFTSRRWLRLILGIAMLATGVVLAHGLGHTGGEWETNDWFARTNTRLIDATIDRLETGDPQIVLASLKQLRLKYQPNYDTRSHFDELVDEAVKTMQTPNSTTTDAPPTPATAH